MSRILRCVLCLVEEVEVGDLMEQISLACLR